MSLENEAHEINTLIDARNRVDFWEYKLGLIDKGVNFNAKLSIDFPSQRRSSCFCYIDFEITRELVLKQIYIYKKIRDILQTKYDNKK